MFEGLIMLLGYGAALWLFLSLVAGVYWTWEITKYPVIHQNVIDGNISVMQAIQKVRQIKIARKG